VAVAVAAVASDVAAALRVVWERQPPHFPGAAPQKGGYAKYLHSVYTFIANISFAGSLSLPFRLTAAPKQTCVKVWGTGCCPRAITTLRKTRVECA